MGNIIGSYTRGKCTCGVFEGEYQGQKTYSFRFQKMNFNKQTNKAEYGDFFNESDLPALAVLVGAIAQKQTVGSFKKIEKKQATPPSEGNVEKDWGGDEF